MKTKNFICDSETQNNINTLTKESGDSYHNDICNDFTCAKRFILSATVVFTDEFVYLKSEMKLQPQHNNDRQSPYNEHTIQGHRRRLLVSYGAWWERLLHKDFLIKLRFCKFVLH
ncbi:MAG: hypothetical protein KKA07_18360 [Bacteroidetes bacterium]|nr:hypothetical protein [Bacteroidota bacterium]MBU1721035.1 hypothetical protein [Bacteroidota bacterium]